MMSVTATIITAAVASASLENADSESEQTELQQMNKWQDDQNWNKTNNSCCSGPSPVQGFVDVRVGESVSSWNIKISYEKMGTLVKCNNERGDRLAR